MGGLVPEFLKRNGVSIINVDDREGISVGTLRQETSASTAQISVSRTTDGRVFDVGYKTKIKVRFPHQARPGRPIPPSSTFFPLESAIPDVGRIYVGRRGEILQYRGQSQLPYLLGPVGLALIVPLSREKENSWGYSRKSELRHFRESTGETQDRYYFSDFGPDVEPGDTIDVVPYTSHTVFVDKIQ